MLDNYVFSPFMDLCLLVFRIPVIFLDYLNSYSSFSSTSAFKIFLKLFELFSFDIYNTCLVNEKHCPIFSGV